MKRAFSFLFLPLIFSFAVISAKENVVEGMEITPQFSKKVIEAITEKYSKKMYEKYAGVKSTRHVTVEWRHPETNDLIETEEVVYVRWDDFYKNLKYEVLEYKVNGKDKTPSKYDPRESKPGIPHFDKNGLREYDLKVDSVEKLRGRLCYKVSAVPKKPKDEHFAGYLWIAVDNLELLQNEGTSGKSRFGVSDLYVRYQAKDFGGFFHFTSGYTRVKLNVLGMYKRILVFRFKNVDIEPMPLQKEKK
ncbi:MAG: hypothetical protein ACOX2F_06940 [bacterium]